MGNGIVAESEFTQKTPQSIVMSGVFCVRMWFPGRHWWSEVNVQEKTGLVSGLEAVFVTQEVEETGFLAWRRRDSRTMFNAKKGCCVEEDLAWFCAAWEEQSKTTRWKLWGRWFWLSGKKTIDLFKNGMHYLIKHVGFYNLWEFEAENGLNSNLSFVCYVVCI